MSKKSHRLKRRRIRQRDRRKAQGRKPVYTEDAPQQESPVYVDDLPFPDPANPTPPPQAHTGPVNNAAPAATPGLDVNAVAAKLIAENPELAKAFVASVQNGPAQQMAMPHPAFDPEAVLKKQTEELRMGIGNIHREFRAIQQAPMEVLLTAASHMLDVGRYVVLEYAKRGQTITLRQGLLYVIRTIEAAEGKGPFALLAALDAHGPASQIQNGQLRAAP